VSNRCYKWESRLIILYRTFKPIDDTEELLDKLEQIAQSLAEDMEHGGWAAKTITLKYKLDTYKGTFKKRLELLDVYITNFGIVYTRAKSCSRYITSKEDLFAVRDSPQTHIPFHLP